jgi:putative pyruvate formate lyase activating enzyme
MEMHRQKGPLVINDAGIAEKGLLIRHLVMPRGLAGTEEIMQFLANDVSGDTYVNIMPQYRPCGKSHEFADISRPISMMEYHDAVDTARKAGITRLDKE